MLLFDACVEENKHAQEVADLRTYRLIEAIMVTSPGAKVPKPGVLFPSLRDLDFTGSEDDVDPEESFRQVQHTLGQFTMTS